MSVLLLLHRLGLPALSTFHEDVVPLLEVVRISEAKHFATVEAVMATSRRKLSIVDRVSFQTMREHAIRRVFCFDSHFREQSFGFVA